MFDAIFYKKMYIDLKQLQTYKELYNHWINYGINENRVQSEYDIKQLINKHDFNYKYYKKIYPDILLDNEYQYFIHWYSSLKIENRIHNLIEFNKRQKSNLDLIDNQIYNTFNNSTNFITIITRTSNRPIEFNMCYKSVLNQSYKNYKHIISCDNEKCDYLTDIKNIIKVKKESNDTGFFNLYLNNVIKTINTGYILILDDDEQFSTNKALAIIASNLEYDKILVYKTMRNDKIIPQTNNIVYGDITFSCFVFHIDQAKNFDFGSNKGADYNFISKFRNFKYLNDILVKTCYNNKICGYGIC